MCKYVYYEETNSRKPMYCTLNNKICIYSQYCTKVGRFIPKDDMENCFMAIEESKKNIPSGARYVRIIDKGFLYIELDDRVIKVKDTLGNVTNYVYIRQYNGDYEISLHPFDDVEEKKETPKKRNTRTKKNA